MKMLQSIQRAPNFSTGVNTKQELQPQTIQSFKQALGDSAPSITPDPLGRYRLLSSLSKKFGPGFRNHPAAAQAMHHFDREYNYYRTLRKTLSTGGGNQNG